MRKRTRDLAETVLLTIGIFAIMAICIAWPFMLVAMGG